MGRRKKGLAGVLGKTLGVVSTLVKSPIAKAVIGIIPGGGTISTALGMGLPLLNKAAPGLIQEPKTLSGVLGMADSLLGGGSAKVTTPTKASRLRSQAMQVATSRNITKASPAKVLLDSFTLPPPVSAKGYSLAKSASRIKAALDEEYTLRQFFPALRPKPVNQLISKLAAVKGIMDVDYAAATAPKPAKSISVT